MDFNTEEAECAEKNAYRELSEELTMLKDLGDFGSRSLFDLLFPIDLFGLHLNTERTI